MSLACPSSSVTASKRNAPARSLANANDWPIKAAICACMKFMLYSQCDFRSLMESARLAASTISEAKSNAVLMLARAPSLSPMPRNSKQHSSRQARIPLSALRAMFSAILPFAFSRGTFRFARAIPARALSRRRSNLTACFFNFLPPCFCGPPPGGAGPA